MFSYQLLFFLNLFLFILPKANSHLHEKHFFLIRFSFLLLKVSWKSCSKYDGKMLFFTFYFLPQLPVAKRRHSKAAAKACSLIVSSVHPENCSTLYHLSTYVDVSSAAQSMRNGEKNQPAKANKKKLFIFSVFKRLIL